MSVTIIYDLPLNSRYGANPRKSKATSYFNSAQTGSTGYDDDDMYANYKKHNIEDKARTHYDRQDFKAQHAMPYKERKLAPGEKPDWQQVQSKARSD